MFLVPPISAIVCWESLLFPGVSPAGTSCVRPQHLAQGCGPSSSLFVSFISGAQGLIALNLWSGGPVEHLLQLNWLWVQVKTPPNLC